MPKILAIDDKQDNLFTLSAILKNLIPECHVITAQSGPEGLEKAKIHSPDTILLDIKMPGMDGYEVCKRLKEDENTKNIPVILISAVMKESKDLVKGLDSGADAYLTKPIDELVFAAQIKTALRLKAAEDSLRMQNKLLEEMVQIRTAELLQKNKQLSNEINERKRAEEALKDSEAFLKTLIDAIPAPVFYKDRDGKYLGFNRAFEEFFGETKERLIGKSVFDINPPELAEVYHAQDDKLFQSGGIQRYESQWENVHGKLRDFIFSKAVFTDSKGTVTGLIGVLIDITERKRAEKALIESERKWRNILVNTPQIGISLDPRARVVFANEQFLKLTGWKEQEVIGRDWFDMFIPQPISEEIRKVFHKTMSQKDPLAFSHYENEISTKSGGLLNVAWYNVVNKDAQGNVSDLTCLGVDLTERKKAENEIIKQKRLFETMFDTIPDGVVITNTQREIQLANKGMESTFGYKPEDLLGKSTQMLYADQIEFREAGTAVYDRNARTSADLYVTRYRDKNGREFSGETFGAKLFDENNQWIGNLGIMRDITEREQSEMRIQQAQKMESIGNLAGGIAHDFNNLLFPIIGMSELLLEDLPRQSQEYENVQQILKAGIRGSDLVNQILAFSRQSEHKFIPVRPQQILKEAMKLIRSTIPSYIEIEENIQSDCGFLMADPTQIHQVAMNIITNAFHTVEAKGGKIAVMLKEVALEADAWPEDVPGPGRYALLSITDTGHGIPPDLMNKIFEPYFTTKEQGKGTGLGLAVAYGIVRKLKGDIKVYSEVGKGTTFNIYLPLMEKAVGTETAKQAEKVPKGNERILLVDDEEIIVDLEKQMLERLGYHVTERTSSSDALKAFKANPSAFDLVISDMSMPNMTGDQLSRELLSVRPDIPVIICTGFSARIDHEKAQRIGVKGFLMKPVVRSEMAKMVRKVLDGPKKSIHE